MLTIKRGEIGKSVHAENAEFGYSFVCRTCPYEFVIDREYYTRRVSKVKEVDDVMGGAAAWENVDQTNSNPPPFVIMSPFLETTPIPPIVFCCVVVVRALRGLLASLPLGFARVLTSSPNVLE